MRNVIAATLAVALMAMSGCALNRSEKGGEVASDKRDFRISAPVMATTVAQGEVQPITVTLHRGEYFRDDVELKVKAPKGINVDPSSVTVAAGDSSSVQFVISAASDAPLATYQVEVQAEPDNGKATWVQFPVKVVARR